MERNRDLLIFAWLENERFRPKSNYKLNVTNIKQYQ